MIGLEQIMLSVGVSILGWIAVSVVQLMRATSRIEQRLDDLPCAGRRSCIIPAVSLTPK